MAAPIYILHRISRVPLQSLSHSDAGSTRFRSEEFYSSHRYLKPTGSSESPLGFYILFGPDKSGNLAALSHTGEAFWRRLVPSVQLIEGKMTPSRMGWDLLMSDLMRESFVVVSLNNFLLLSRQSNGSFFATQ